jgi:hypothetical protein
MKDDVNDEVPNRTPKTLIFFYGVVNWDGVLMSGGRPRWPWYTFMRLDKKTYSTKFDL